MFTPRCLGFNGSFLRYYYQPGRSFVTVARLTSSSSVLSPPGHVGRWPSHKRDRLSDGLIPVHSNLLSRSLRISSNHGSVENPNPDMQGKPAAPADQPQQPPAKPSLFQRFKQMYKDYWYVLIPVHAVTSVGWTAIFYFSIKNGLDVVALLERMNVSEKIINPLRSSSVGYYALTYALYKVASPVRYAVTIGGTTWSINYLTKWGYIKPVPSKAEMQLMYEDRKERFDRKRDELRRKLRQHRAELKKRVGSKKGGARKG